MFTIHTRQKAIYIFFVTLKHLKFVQNNNNIPTWSYSGFIFLDHLFLLTTHNPVLQKVNNKKKE